LILDLTTFRKLSNLGRDSDLTTFRKLSNLDRDSDLTTFEKLSNLGWRLGGIIKMTSLYTFVDSMYTNRYSLYTFALLINL